MDARKALPGVGGSGCFASPVAFLPGWQGILVSLWETNLPHLSGSGGQVVLMWLLRGLQVIRQ